ncbi:hypothetical protein GCM10027586_04350 [Kineococcus gypseus]|uniref:hypothetical protein n=1 Tax=Kineococcus gypseus TaxID=1637102 RepID=UPI003D7CF6D8
MSPEAHGGEGIEWSIVMDSTPSTPPPAESSPVSSVEPFPVSEAASSARHDEDVQVADDIEVALAAQIALVERRVAGGGDLLAAEREHARLAAEQVRRLHTSLRLGPLRQSLSRDRAKPQFLMLFEDLQGDAVVLKTYGRIRPGEAWTQRLWHQAGVRVVPVHAFGDDPVSWLLMRHLLVEPLSAGGEPAARTSVGERVALTAELAALLEPAHAVGATAVGAAAVGCTPAGAAAVTDVTPHQPPQVDEDLQVGEDLQVDGGRGVLEQLQTLHQAIGRHLGGAVRTLQHHGYSAPAFQDQLQRYLSGDALTLLHGDLVDGNVVRDAGDHGLVLLDTCGYVGPAEFDAARWAARTGGAAHARELLATWLSVEAGLDEHRAEVLLGLELLMEAGVRELVKAEQHRPWNYPDATTLNLLSAAGELLAKARRP